MGPSRVGGLGSYIRYFDRPPGVQCLSFVPLASGGASGDHWARWPPCRGRSTAWLAASRRRWTRTRRSSAPWQPSERGSAGGSARRGSRRRSGRTARVRRDLVRPRRGRRGVRVGLAQHHAHARRGPAGTGLADRRARLDPGRAGRAELPARGRRAPGRAARRLLLPVPQRSRRARRDRVLHGRGARARRRAARDDGHARRPDRAGDRAAPRRGAPARGAHVAPGDARRSARLRGHDRRRRPHRGVQRRRGADVRLRVGGGDRSRHGRVDRPARAARAPSGGVRSLPRDGRAAHPRHAHGAHRHASRRLDLPGGAHHHQDRPARGGRLRGLSARHHRAQGGRGGAARLAREDRRGRRRRAPPARARPPRRRSAAARRAGAPAAHGARAGSTPTRARRPSSSTRRSTRSPTRRPSCASWRAGSIRSSSPRAV